MSTAYVVLVCSCGALPKFIEELKLFWFLAGLNKSYSTVKSNILMMNPIPNISRAYSMLQLMRNRGNLLTHQACLMSQFLSLPLLHLLVMRKLLIKRFILSQESLGNITQVL